MKKILLVSPYSENEAMWVTGEETSEVRNNFPPIGLATLAALAPRDRFQVQIWDENVHGLIKRVSDVGEKYDLVGLTGYIIHMPRCRQVADIFRGAGVPVAIGGPGISSVPYLFRDYFDILFINEAEHTWPQFLADWEAGRHGPEYRQIDKPNLEHSPLPQWDSIAGDMKRYAMGGVQTTRGCPYDCDFCDVIYLFGRRPRHKPIDNILEEVRAFERFGMRQVMFCDDEFSGDRPFSKQLLRALIALNRSFKEPCTFTTQVSIAMAKDDEFLNLMADANFDLVFVGIETPNKESLKGANKGQNLRGDLSEDVHKVLAHGIGIRAGMIVGFDQDEKDIFDHQYEFIQKACLTSVGINILKAPTGTPLWSRLMREGRVLDLSKLKERTNLRAHTNIVPKGMTRVELMRGYHGLLQRVYSWESFCERVRGFVSLAQRRTGAAEGPWTSRDEDRLMAELRLDARAAEAVTGLLRHTERTAPHLMHKVRTVTVQHGKYRETVMSLLPQIVRQIELEESGQVILQVDRRAVPPPENFRKEFNRVFHDVHRRVYINLRDVNHVPAALTEIFVDFLVRWGEEVERLEDFHVSFIKEISDRTCAKLNGVPPESFVSMEESDEPLPDIRKLRLADDIFKNVWIEISELRMKERQHAGARTEEPVH